MSDGAAEAAEQDRRDEPEDRDEPDPRGHRDARAQAVLRLGAAGFGRAEIARALRMCPEALDQREAEDPRLATALRGAAGLAQAWWEELAREAFKAGRFSQVAWSREMRRRFGEDGGSSGGRTGAPKANRWLRGERPRVTYVIPCNGRTKPNPDGTCPCDSCRSERPSPVLDDEDDDLDLSDDDDVLEDQE